MTELNKIMKIAVRNRALLLLVVILALVAVADHLSEHNQQVAAGGNQVLTSGAVSPDETPGKQAGNSTPTDDGAAAQLVQFVWQIDNGSARGRLRESSIDKWHFRTESASRIGQICATPSLIDSGLGRQFTLVGARPSGTS